MPHHRPRWRGNGAAPALIGSGGEPGSGPVCLRAAAPDGAADAQGRGSVRPLRPMRGTLSHRGLGHAEIRSPHFIRRERSVHQLLRTRVNDFALKLANVNGTGSASANGLLMQAIFRMGIPVSGKNLFPSNIQGLPTWYEIRVNKDGYTARALDYDLMVAMNSQTYGRDIREVREGGYLLYDSTWPLDPHLARDDITFLGVPLSRMCNETFKDARERILMKNIAYAGALVAILDVDMGIVEQLLDEKFSAKKALRESNLKALKLGYDYAQNHFECPLPFRLEKMNA